MLHERVLGGDVEGTLFPLLHDLKRGIIALLSASPRTSNHFDEHFDLDWLLERHQNRSIGVDDIRRYKRFVCEMIRDMSAPADAEAVQKWMDDEDSHIDGINVRRYTSLLCSGCQCTYAKNCQSIRSSECSATAAHTTYIKEKYTFFGCASRAAA